MTIATLPSRPNNYDVSFMAGIEYPIPDYVMAQVANVQRIITSPALLESTSLVFAYGLDMFLTRVAPSNTFDVLSENFNKAQLVLTIAALTLAIFITKPMVRRRKLRERWYN